jgi:hypothetical protein
VRTKKTVRSLAAAIFLLSVAFANTAGPNSPGGATASGTGNSWTSPTNVFTSNGVFASVFVSAAGTSNQLQVTNFGFAIPTGSTINGIMIETQNQSPNPSQLGILVQLLKGGAAAGVSKSLGQPNAYPNTEAFVTFGNSTDLWSGTWAPADINNAGFGVQQQALEVTGLAGATANVDFVRITITYTPPALPPGSGKHRTIETQTRSGAIGHQIARLSF